MRILAVTPYYVPEGGGLERYAAATLERIAKHHEVRLVTTTRGVPRTGLRDGVHVTSRRAPIHLGNAPLDPGLAGALRRQVRSWHPDVMIAHTPVPGPAETAARVAKQEGIPFVLTYHSGRLRGSNPALDTLAWLARNTIERRMIGRAERLIAVTPFVHDNALASRAGVHVIPPGVDHVRYRPLGGKRRDDRPEILFVGPLSNRYRWKGVDILWQAFRHVRRRHPEASLRLIGSGDRFTHFARKAAHDPLVHVEGRVDEQRLIEAYRQCHVLALPSTLDAESFGMVLAEANSCGRPVVGSNIGGIPHFIDDGRNGILVRPGSVERLADALSLMIADPDLADAMGHKGRQKVLRHHGWDDIAARTEDVLVEAVETTPRPGRRAVHGMGTMTRVT